MNREIMEKIDALIQDHYPWGEDKFLLHLSQDRNANMKSVSLWLEQETTPFRAAALSLAAIIDPILKDLENKLSPKEKSRFFASIDHTSIVKSPDSILEKMARAWNPEKTVPPITFHNFRNEFQDLGRFRIVTNFLSDMNLVKDTLETPFKSTAIPLSTQQKRMIDEFQLNEDHFEDKVCLLPEKRSKGERCYKGVFSPRKTGLNIYKVEVQIQTQLQEAWDKKDHFLIYEPRRRGEDINPDRTIEMFSMSELLYIADLTFDRLKKTIIEEDKIKGGEFNAL